MATPRPARPSYPVHITADPLPDRPSRGLWLVKWLLVIPHVLILMFLWLACLVLTVIAFFAILFTGRYPRPIFDFVVGVMRWTWRVGYYSYGALGTDRYPPFSLHDDPSYPAHLDVDYPDELSRGLVLVKWWLLAIPHYLIVAVITGAGARAARDTAGVAWAWEGGLIAVLVLIAGVALLFTARYPQGLYDLTLGLNRWTLRVAGYAALLTDQYPPFYLDQGGRPDTTPAPHLPPPHDATAAAHLAPPDDTAPATQLPPPAPRPGTRDPRPPTSRWTAGRVAVVTLGTLALLLGSTAVVGGATLLDWEEGDFYTTPTRTIGTAGYAVATDELLLEGSGLDQGLGRIRVRAEAVDGTELFVGVGHADDVRDYLAGVSHTELLGRTVGGRLQHSGGPPQAGPQEVDFWVASSAGPGRQPVEVDAQAGSWTVVVMAADASPGLEIRGDVGATLPWVASVATALLPLGALLILGGALAIGLSLRSASVRPRPGHPAAVGPPPAAPTTRE